MSKPKLIIVDDEELSADGLAMVIQGLKIPVDLVQVFYSSPAALAFLEKNPVDIVITDLNMPELSGLELIEKLKHLNPTTQIMVLTGFGTLEYAQQAMKFGVKYFLQKPCIAQELIDNFTHCFADLERIQQNVLLQKKQVIESYLLGEHTETTATKKLGHFSLMLLASANFSTLNPLLEKHLQQVEADYTRGTINGAAVYYIFHPHDFTPELSKTLEQSGLVVWKSNLKLAEVPALFKLAGKIFPLEFYYDKLTYIEAGSFSFGPLALQPELDALAKLLASNNYTQAQVEFANFLKQAKTSHYPPDQLVAACQTFLAKYVEKPITLSQKFAVIQTLTALKKEIAETLVQIENEKGIENKQSSIPADINWLIEQFYGESDFSLKWIYSEKLFLNPEYLGKTYLKKTGVKFSHKLLEVRMKNAVRLLDEGFRVYEVAEKVGYATTPDYFIQVFKKYYHKTPKQYVQEKQKNRGY